MTQTRARSLGDELRLRLMTVFPGPELTDAVWNAEVMARAEGIATPEDPDFDRFVARAVAETLNAMLPRIPKARRAARIREFIRAA